ncbi:MAG: small-conductance mechanosensitive channel [Chitinophagales bacterium]|jgi:small-conductance mechanosensitive channel
MKEFLDVELFTWNEHVFHLSNIVLSLFVLAFLPFAFLLFRKFVLNSYFKRKGLEEGRRYAISQLIKYVVYTLTFMLVFQSLGLKLSVLWAAGAALLVGIGLGLQQTFNDFASGVILLMEGTVQKGDWIEVGNTMGEVKKIGLRTSLITSRRNISIIVPNSKITVDNVINFSHDNDTVRHTVAVGVAYGSDVQLVKRVLLECAERHSKVLPGAFVRLVEFNNSSVDFELLFWSNEYQRIEDVRSDLRFMIDQGFRKFHITIPFPQQDLYIKQMPDSLKEKIVKTDEENKPIK